MEPTLKALLGNVKRMVEAEILTQDYEVTPFSFICFYFSMPGTANGMFYTGRVDSFPLEIQQAFIGAYLNDRVGNYKITGIYKIADGPR